MFRWKNKWKFKRYLKRIRKAYKKLYKYVPHRVEGKGQFLHYLGRADIYFQRLLDIWSGALSTEQELENKRKELHLTNEKIRNLRKQMHEKHKQKLNHSVHLREYRIYLKELRIITNEIKLLKKQLSRDLATNLRDAEKVAKNQLKIIKKEIALLGEKYGEYIYKHQTPKAKKNARRHYKRNVLPYLKKLSKL